MLAPVLLTLSACGGDAEARDTRPAGPDRSNFVAITAPGIAAVVDRHLGDRVRAYSVFSDQPGGKVTARTIQVRLRGADRRDTFLVSVYPEGGSQGEVAKGDCSKARAQADPQAEVTCSPAPGGGNVTITRLPFALTDGNDRGRYLRASGSGPEQREASVSYESFTRKLPISDQDLDALLGDPYLGWQTDPRFNKAGRSLTVAPARG